MTIQKPVLRQQLHLRYGLILRRCEGLALSDQWVDPARLEEACDEATRTMEWALRDNRPRALHQARSYLERILEGLRNPASESTP